MATTNRTESAMGAHVNVYCRANTRRRMGILRPWIAGLPAVIALLCLQAAPSWAQWSPGGVILCNYAASCQGRSPWIIADGHHGAYVAWSRVLGFSPEVDNIYLQHLTWAGTVNPGWPSAGLQTTQVLTPEGTEGMAPDLEGGVYLLWADGRNGAGVGNGQAFLTRVTANGSIAAGWPAQGLNVVPDSTQGLGALASDGQGGVFVTLVDYRLGGFEGDIYVQHVLADGTIAPGWPALGKPVVRCPGQQAFFSEAPDGHGGLFAAWPTAAGTSANVQIQHMLADGGIAWDSCGRTIALGMTLGTLVPSRGGGIAVTAVLYPPTFADNDLYTVGFDSTGAIRPEWAAGPLPAVVAPSDQFNFDYGSDGAGGLFVSWDDQRNYAIDATDRYVQHIADNGAPAPGWAVNGVPAVASPIFDTQTGFGTTTLDGSGGVYVLAERTGNNDPSSGIYVGHVAAGGQVAPGWSPAGETLTLPPFGDGADRAMMCSDGAGGAIAVISALSILVQHISPDAPVPTEVSLSRVDARSDGVSLAWYAGGGGLAQATVEREHGSDGW
ncbi:MAG TPA: hypothetical protein VGU27_12415, partial [Candidatus Eisenbacteria bacterium]|nr:hypothetical protein [Candidatus Eisenbacteria bacterium]